MGALAVELFLQENYLFRRNLLSGKVEYKNREPTADTPVLPNASDGYRPLTKEAFNSIVIRAKREDICEGGSPKTDIDEYVHSEEVPMHNPIGEFLERLPEWDGQNHVGSLLRRLPGLSSEQTAFMSTWMRSMVAHWLQTDTLHGNEVVPTLIGRQGCGKTTFLRRLLPKELRMYFMDSINLGNRFDKEMALTNNLLVNLDELEAIRPSQQASLKQTLSVSKVNGRPIYGAAQEDKPRFASFTATTNNRHPLTDATGSRRYICIEIPEGELIDNSGEIDHLQLYAQLVYELREMKAPYWFTNDEVARLQELNLDYMEQKNLDEIVCCCFRKPEDNEVPKRLTCGQLLERIRAEFPSLPKSRSTSIQLGLVMKGLGFKSRLYEGRNVYELIPKKSA